MIEAGVLGLRLQPIATGFWRQTDAKLRAQKASNAEVKVEANIRKASTEIAAFRMREQANAINLRVKVDENSIRTATDKIKYVEHTWKQSDIKRAIRVQVYTAGASALPALTQGLMSVTAAMTELGRVSLALPGLLAGVGSAAATLATGLNGIGAAFKASNDGMQKSSQYARDYARATRDLEDAQRDVVKALKDANRELEDQKSKLARGQLSVEEAQLSVRRANEELFRGGFKSITDYQQALLNVKSANLDLSDAVKENSRNISDYYENAGRGAAGSNTFKDSLDKLSNSVDNFHKAQFQAAGMSEQFINAMKNLAPAGQDFVLQVLKMKGAWQGLQNSVQTTLFKGLGDEITALANKQLPVLKTGMQQVAAGLNDGLKSIFAALGRQSNTNSIAKIFENTGKAISASTPGLDSFTSGLLKLSEVGSRFLPRIALAFDKVMGKFEAFINKADQDGSLNRWIDSGLKLVASLGRSLLSIGSILDSVTSAYNKATGNVGGFASTMERGLASFAKRLGSAEGQGMLIKWMRTSREFMAVIADSLPGIGKLLGAIGDGAREFAALWFPRLAQFGNSVGGASGALKTLVAVTLTWRTAAPVISSVTKLWNLLNASMQKYTEKRAALLSTRTGAWKAAFDADGVKFAAEQRLRLLRDEVKETDDLYTRMLNSRVAGQRTLAQAERDREAAEAKAKASKKAANKDGLDPIAAKNAKAVYKADAEAFKQAKIVEANALADFNMRDERFTNAAAERSRVRRDLEVNRGKAYRDVRVSTDLAAKAQENFNKVNRLTADGMSGKWARSTTFMKDKLLGLKSVLGFLGGVGASAGIAVGVAVAFDQLTAAQNRNKESADNLKESQQALAQTLSKGTGAATAATLEENVRQLKDRANPVHPDDRGQNFDAAKILEGQLGIPLAEAASLALPTEIKKREARLAPADAQVGAAVPSLDIWRQWGSEFQKNGVTAAIYGKALNGDPDSMAKVAAAREAIKNERTPGLNMGAAVVAGTAPNDLGAAQEQLPRSGPYGGLRGLSLATGAERSIGNEAYNQGQKLFENSQVIPQKGLNSKGSGTFGPFVLGAHGAILNPDGSAVIEVDRYPDAKWIEEQNDKGISVERRFPGGAVITIDAEHGRQYFNSYAMGGPVWGAGTATSDSIPAMLSNGEFVINAKSASMIGHDKLHAMNKYANGGLVRGFEGGGSPGDGGGSIIGNAWDWFKNLISPDPVGMVPGDSRRPDAAENGYGPVAIPAPIAPPVRTDPVDSAPVERPYTPPAPPAPKGIGAVIANGINYLPKLGGSGALPDFGTTGLSGRGMEKAPVNRDANILDYMVQVANAYGLTPGSGPPNTEYGKQVARLLGIPDHGNPDGMQHDVFRALDIGSTEQAQDGRITSFVKSWLSDPQKVAATRQLIYQDPKTGESFGIINGRALSGAELQSVYGSAFPDHRNHAHISMEGVPLNAFTVSSATPAAIGTVPGIGTVPVTGPTATPAPPKVAPGPAASAPKGDVQIASPDAVPGTIPGPFGAIPFDPIYILKQIGAAILNGIFAFFGIDGSGFVDALFALGDKPIGPQVTDVPEPDQELVAGLDAQIAQYEALGTPTGKEMADQIRAGKDKYLKQFEGQDAAKSAETAAAYFDSIGQPDVAKKLRAGVEANPERFSPVVTVPGTGGTPTVLPRPDGDKGTSGGLTAPKANYSGGTPETHNAIYRAFKEAGYPDSEWPSLVQLLNHENDTYDPTRPTGGPNSDASGIFQFLSSTWGEVGMQPSDDPYQQSVAGMRYIKKRYGTPTGAWNFWQNPNPPGPDPNWPHWYSTGGMVHLARGGMVKGPGTGTSDSIPAMLSAGEFVMRADAVKSIGADRLNAMNCYSGGGLATASGGTWIDIPDINYDPKTGTYPNLAGVIQQPPQLPGDGAWIGAAPNPYAQDYLNRLSGGGMPTWVGSGPGLPPDPNPTPPPLPWGQQLALGAIEARRDKHTQESLRAGIAYGANMKDDGVLDHADRTPPVDTRSPIEIFMGEMSGTVGGHARGGLIRRYAPGGPVIPTDPEQQKAMLRDAFQTRAAGMDGGGGSYLGSAPGTLDHAKEVWQDTGQFAYSTLGKFLGAADQLVTGAAPLVGAGDLLNNLKRKESELRGIPDLSIKDYKAPGVAESWKAMASAAAPLVGAGNVVNDALGINYEPRRRIGDEGIPSGTRDAYKNLLKGVTRYDEYKEDGASTAGATVFDLATAFFPGGAAFRTARAATATTARDVVRSGLKSISPGPRQASVPGENALIPGTDIEIPTAFDPYKMRRTQAAWVKKNTKGIDFKLAGIPKAAQQEIKASMAYLQSVAPTKMHEVVADWDLAGSRTGGDNNTIAYTNLGVRASTGKVGGRIMINPDLFQSVYKNTKDAKMHADPFGPWRGFHPDPGAKSGFFHTLAHEYGHVLDMTHLWRGSDMLPYVQYINDLPDFGNPLKRKRAEARAQGRFASIMASIDPYRITSSGDYNEYRANTRTITNRRALSDWRYRELLDEKFGDQFADVIDSRVDQLGYSGAYSAKEYAKFIRSRLSGYSYKIGKDMELVSGLRQGQSHNYRKETGLDGKKFRGTIQDLVTSIIVGGPESPISKSFETMFGYIPTPSTRQYFAENGRKLNPAEWAINTIERNESIAEAFSDVMSRGAKAERGHKTVYNVLQQQLSQRGVKIPKIADADYTGRTEITQGLIGQGWLDKASSDKIFGAFKGMVKPFINTQMARRLAREEELAAYAARSQLTPEQESALWASIPTSGPNANPGLVPPKPTTWVGPSWEPIVLPDPSKGLASKRSESGDAPSKMASPTAGTKAPRRGAIAAAQRAAWIRKNTRGIDFDLSLAPRSMRKEIKAAVAELQAMAPTKIGRVRVGGEFQTADELANAGLGISAKTGDLSGTISLNPAHFSKKSRAEFDADAIAMEYAGWHPKSRKGAVFGTIAHEYGHILDMMHLREVNSSYKEIVNDLGIPLNNSLGTGRRPTGLTSLNQLNDYYNQLQMWGDFWQKGMNPLGNLTPDGLKPLTNKRFAELLDDQLRGQYDDTVNGLWDQGYMAKFSHSNPSGYARFVRSALSKYSYKGGDELGKISNVGPGDMDNLMDSMGVGSVGFHNFITQAMTNPYRGMVEHIAKFTGLDLAPVKKGWKDGIPGSRFVFNPTGADEWAIASVKRSEALAEAFQDVASNGSAATPGSQAVFNVMRQQLAERGVNMRGIAEQSAEAGSLFDPTLSSIGSFISGIKLKKKYQKEIDQEQNPTFLNAFSDNPSFNFFRGRPASDNTGFADPTRGPKPPTPGRTPGALTWDAFAAAFDDIYPFSVEEGRTGWDPYKLVGDNGVNAQGHPLGMISKVPNNPPLGSPFDTNQMRELIAYSGSSWVNKAVRGSDGLPLRARILEELLAIHPQMSERANPEFPNRNLFTGRFTDAKPGEVLRIINENQNLPVRDVIDILRQRNSVISEKQYWDAWFVEHLGASRIKAATVKEKLKQAEIIRSAFDQVPPLERGFWMTRMVEDFGPDVDLSDPQSLVGQLLPANPSFSSFSGGIASKQVQTGRGFEWRMRGGNSGANPFQGRPIMQQTLVPPGAKAIWFGGHENEVLVEDGLQYLPWGQMDIREAAGVAGNGEMDRYYETVARKMEAMTGRPVPRKTKFWGTAQFDKSAMPDAIAKVGLRELEALMRPLGRTRNGGPAWLNLVSQQSENNLLPPYSEFRDMPALHALNYAAGGHVSGPGGPKSDMIPAMLSNGEFVMNAAATRHWGTDRLYAMNRYEAGGLVPPPMTPIIQPPLDIKPPPPPPDPTDGLAAGTALGANVDLKKVTDALQKPLFPTTKSPDSGSSDPDAFKNLDDITPASLGSTLFSPKGGGSGGSASARSPRSKDPRAILGAAPTSDSHINPALAAGIKGGFNTVGAIVSQVAGAAGAAGSAGITQGAPIPGAGQATSALVSAGFQMAGDVAVGAANIISSLLVGTVTPSDTGQGYGAPLLPQQQPGAAMNNFQSIHNGNVVTNNLSEYSRLKDRKDAQKAAPFFSRVNQ
jgi:hypothetical protein